MACEMFSCVLAQARILLVQDDVHADHLRGGRALFCSPTTQQGSLKWLATSTLPLLAQAATGKTEGGEGGGGGTEGVQECTREFSVQGVLSPSG